MKKTCSKCGVEKAVSEFHKCKTGKYGVRGDCKECNIKRVMKYNGNNTEKHKEYKKRYYQNNKEKIKLKEKEHRQNNKESILKRKREIYKERYTNDPQYRLNLLIRDFTRRVTTAVKQQKELRSLEYLGCSLEEFKSHIESLWLDGMSWENHGDWHIDHIIPLDYFVKNSDDPWKANHYSNLQPLWAEANLSKGNRL